MRARHWCSSQPIQTIKINNPLWKWKLNITSEKSKTCLFKGNLSVIWQPWKTTGILHLTQWMTTGILHLLKWEAAACLDTTVIRKPRVIQDKTLLILYAGTVWLLIACILLGVGEEHISTLVNGPRRKTVLKSSFVGKRQWFYSAISRAKVLKSWGVPNNHEILLLQGQSQ